MYTIDKGLSLGDLKKELPELKSRHGTSDEHNADVKKDQENSKVWRANCVRDNILCDECGFVRCIYSEYAKGGSSNECTKEEQERRWALLQGWK